MENKMNLNSMCYKDLVAGFNEMIARSYDYLKAINFKREEAMKEAVSSYKKAMANLGFSEEEMKACLDEGFYVAEPSPENVVDFQKLSHLLESPQNNDRETLALPEFTQESKEETEVSINPASQEENKMTSNSTSVFDSPALKASYTFKDSEMGDSTSSQEQTKEEAMPDAQEENEEEDFPTMESLLSIDPRYKALYAGEPPIKENKSGMPTMEALLSNEPVNQILNLGNLSPEGKFGQHTRVCDPKGICPTLTATGNSTLVYRRS